jgi:hypothetical protein
MRPTRLIASATSVLVTAAMLTVPSLALAEEPASQDERVILQPAPPQDEPKADDRAKPAADQEKSKSRRSDHPPVSRARVITDLREAAKCAGGSDRSWVVVPGPGDVRVAGWAQCSGGDWSFDVTTGSGHVGGMTLKPTDFAGSMSIPRQGVASSTVRVRLPWGASALPKGDVSAFLDLSPSGRELAGTVDVVDVAKAGRITMSGSVRGDGTFILKGRGSVLFAGESVPMSGVYRSGSNGVRGRGTAPTWNFAGLGANVRIPGAAFDGPRLRISHEEPGIRGTSAVRIAQYDISSPVRIAVIDGDSWNATLLGAKGGPVKDSRLSGLVLRADGATGSISSIRGRTQWNVRMPMTLVDGAITLRGNATLIGPDKLRLAPTSGVGDIYGTGRVTLFTQSAGSLVLQGRTSSGRLAMGAIGEQLVDMPAGWTSMSVLELTPRFGSGPAATLERSLRYVMTDRTSRVTLAGRLPASGPFTLQASGHLGIGNTKVPVQGRYVGAGPRQSSTPGKLLITANTDRAPKGYADLGSGARAQDTTFIVSTDSSASSVTRSVTSRALSLPTVTVKSKNNTSSTGGTVTLQVSGINGDDSITFTANWTYTPATTTPAPGEPGYYTVTIKGTGSAYWEPYEGLRIPYSSISGSITADDSTHVSSWYIDVNPAVTWNVGDGITLTSSFRFSSTCTQDMAKTCPDPKNPVPGTFFVSGKSSILNIPVMAGVTIPELTAYGAFRSDGLWARWDAEVKGGDTIKVDGPADSSISLTDAQVALFSSAQREDTSALPPNLQMPDLSALSKSGMNVQACGSFKIVIFEISTGNVPGCVALTKKGKVVAQTNTGGDTGGAVTPTDTHDENGDGNGLSLDANKPPRVNGYAYSDIDTKSTPTKTNPTVKLYNKAISMAPKVNNFTAAVPVPASLMESFGTGTSQDTTLIATGFFAPKTNELYIDLDIPVDLKASGVHVEDINMSIDRRKDSATPDYDFWLDASGEAAIQGHHYPFDASLEVKKGKTNYAEVSLAVIGETNTQTIGDFDDASYLPQGDFEPASPSLVDGSFDDSQPANDFADGGFEAGSFADNLIPDASFEDSASFNLLPKDQSTFDGDQSGNVLPNPDYEETNVVYNDDFEGVDGVDAKGQPLGWGYTSDSNLQYYVVSDPGPSGSGTQVACVKNVSSTTEGYSTGVYQNVMAGVTNGATYKLSGYLRGDSGSDKAFVSFKGRYVSASKDVSPNGWTYFEVTSGGSSGTFEYDPITIYLSAAKDSDKASAICYDDLRFERISGNVSETVGSIKQPDMLETFDGESSTWGLMTSSGVSRVNLAGDNYALKTDGCDEYWTSATSKRGWVVNGKVPWDMSVNIFFAAGSGEERADIGFLMDTYGSKASGYMYRLRTSGNDGGFHTLQSGSTSGFGGDDGAVPRGKWLNVRLVGWDNKVTAVVTDLGTGNVLISRTATMPAVYPSGSTVSGYFGQFPSKNCASPGTYWDNLRIRTPQTGVGVVQDSNTARGGSQRHAIVTGGSSSWSGYTAIGQPLTGGKTYTYTAWVRAKSGTVSGNLAIKGISNVWNNTSERVVSRGFTVGTSWTQVRVTMTPDIDYSDVAVGFTATSNSSPLYVDDQSFQQMPYERYVANNGTLPLADVVPDPKDSTDNVLLYQPVDSNSSSLYYWVGKPYNTTRYTLSAKVRSVSGTQKGSIQIYDGDGSSAGIVDFTATADETTIQLPPMASKGGSNDLRFAFNLPGGSSGIYIDDVTLTATETSSGQTSGTLGQLPPPSGWNKSSSSSAFELVNQQQHARTGNAYLRIGPGQFIGRIINTSAVPGQTYTASVWLKAPNGDIKADVYLYGFKGSTSTNDYTWKESVPVSSSGYTEVKLTLPIKASGIDNFRLWVANESSSSGGGDLAIDDVSLALDGMSIVDKLKVSGNVGLVATDDAVNAHDSEDYLAITSKGSSSVWIEPSVKASSATRTFSAWVRTPSGTTTGSLTLAQSGGSTATTKFTADSTWRQVLVTLTGVSTDSAKTFTSKISLDGDSTLWVDDLITRDVTPFVPTGSGVTAAVVGAPSDASSLPNYLLVSAAAGKGVSAPTNVSTPILGGATYSVRAHVKAASGTVTGTIGLDFGSTAGTPISPQLETGDSVNFTADDTWQQITATFQAPEGSFSQITPKFTLGGAAGGTIHLDTVTVSPVKIALAQQWTAVTSSGGQSVAWGVWDDPSNAHDGSLGVLKMKTSGSGDAGVSTNLGKSSAAGEVYSATVWVRSDSTSTAKVTAELRARGGSNAEEAATGSVTLSGEWQLINIRLPITKSHSDMSLKITTNSPGVQIYVDDASVVQNRWSVTDTANRTNIVANPSFETDTSGWTNRNGSQVIRSDYHGYSGPYSGELVRADNSTSDDFILFDLGGKIAANQTYTVSAYVWLPEGAQASDVYGARDLMWAVDYGTGGVVTTAKPDFAKTVQWQRIVTTIKASTAPQMNVRFYVPTDGGWYIDALLVEQGSTASGYFEGTRPSTTLSVVGDGPGAYEGNGYAQLSTVNSAGGSMTAVAAGTISGAQNYTVYVRSANGEPVQAKATLAGACTTESETRTVADEWVKLDATCSSASGTLTMGVTLVTPGGVLDVDSIRLSNEPEKPIQYGNIFGVTSPLDHPQSGYRYLWDDAFGIPGMHLWGFAVQIEVDDGEPGLGVQATVYQDPTKAKGLLYGTDWIKGDALIKFSEVSPCFDFGFQTVSESGQPMGNSGLSIADGAIKAEDFRITFAPRGCAVGGYKVAPGASVLFDALVGDGTLHFDLDITKNSQGQPEFDGDLHVTDLNIGGIDYRDLEMSVHVTPTDDSVTYKADMQLPMGGFKGNFTMTGATVGADQGVHVDGDVELTDWGWKSSSGKGMKINVFDFDMSMDVDATNCGTLTATAKANASMDFASATSIDFDGHFVSVCGLVTELQIRFDYKHGGLTDDFYLNYDSKALTISGGVAFEFQRKESWKYMTYRYHRTARITASLDFVMDVTNPSNSEADLSASVKMANASGSFECWINGQPNDTCKIYITVDGFLGSKKFTETW